jgi:anti-anti-sigma factor
MDISTEKEKNYAIVGVKGKIDAVTSPEFEKSLSDLINQGDKILLMDLTGLEYISSAGLRSILSTAKKLKTVDGQMIFFGLQGSVKDVFRISGFGSIFKIHDSEADAIKGL